MASWLASYVGVGSTLVWLRATWTVRRGDAVVDAAGSTYGQFINGLGGRADRMAVGALVTR